jgi:hypothetical protein
MPPKAKASKKVEPPSDKELLLRAEAELFALKRLLELKTYEVRLVQCIDSPIGKTHHHFTLANTLM